MASSASATRVMLASFRPKPAGAGARVIRMLTQWVRRTRCCSLRLFYGAVGGRTVRCAWRIGRAISLHYHLQRGRSDRGMPALRQVLRRDAGRRLAFDRCHVPDRELAGRPSDRTRLARLSFPETVRSGQREQRTGAMSRRGRARQRRVARADRSRARRRFRGIHGLVGPPHHDISAGSSPCNA